MNRDGFEFDLKTQRFLVNRWESEVGQQVYAEVIEGIKHGIEIRAVLDPYILEHPDNQDPYGHPYYPKEEMQEDVFWVITPDDLRGIHIYNEQFPKNSSLTVKSLNYARFYNCSFNGTSFERTSLTKVYFEKCDLKDTSFAAGGGYGARFINCDMQNVCFLESVLIEADFSDSNLTGAYFDAANLTDITINYLTIMDKELHDNWLNQSMHENQKPELLKSIRLAYKKAEIWSLADEYLYLERIKNRKALLWPRLIKNITLNTFQNWITDFIWGQTTGYGVKPVRLLYIGFFVAMIFASIFYIAGNPGNNSDFVTSIYYSFTTFATLGYGDLYYLDSRWVMRIISTVEALCGAVLLATFVAVMARKVLRN